MPEGQTRGGLWGNSLINQKRKDYLGLPLQVLELRGCKLGDTIVVVVVVQSLVCGELNNKWSLPVLLHDPLPAPVSARNLIEQIELRVGTHEGISIFPQNSPHPKFSSHFRLKVKVQ